MDHNRPRFPDQDIVLVVRNPHRAGALGKLLSAIGEVGALVGDLTTRTVSPYHSIREITVSVYDDDHLVQVLNIIRTNTEAEVIETCDLVIARHQGGKIHCGRKQDIKLLSDLRYIYTPGVARVCRAIQRDPAKALELTGITKSFDGFMALSAADFAVVKGEVHALLGENGAGKTSLMNVAAGLYAPDEGQIRINGARVMIRGPIDAKANSIGMVHKRIGVEPKLYLSAVKTLKDTINESLMRCIDDKAHAAQGPD